MYGGSTQRSVLKTLRMEALHTEALHDTLH